MSEYAPSGYPSLELPQGTTAQQFFVTVERNYASLAQRCQDLLDRIESNNRQIIELRQKNPDAFGTRSGIPSSLEQLKSTLLLNAPDSDGEGKKYTVDQKNAWVQVQLGSSDEAKALFDEALRAQTDVQRLQDENSAAQIEFLMLRLHMEHQRIMWSQARIAARSTHAQRAETQQGFFPRRGVDR